MQIPVLSTNALLMHGKTKQILGALDNLSAAIEIKSTHQ